MEQLYILFSLIFVIAIFFLSYKSFIKNKKRYFRVKQNKLNVKIFILHRIADPKFEGKSTNITLDNLEKLLKVLNEQYDEIITCNELLKKKDGNYALITIDDGFKSILNGLELFDKYNTKFTVFINAKEINNKSPAYLTWEQLKDLKKNGHEISNHGFSHTDLTLLTEEQIKFDIKKNHEAIFKNLNISCKSFAYPNGLTNQSVVNILKDMNYQQAFGQHSGIYSLNHDKFYIPRFSADQNTLDDKLNNYNKGINITSISPKYTISENPCQIILEGSSEDYNNFNIVAPKHKLEFTENKCIIKFQEKFKNNEEIRITLYSKNTPHDHRWGYLYHFREQDLWFNDKNIKSNFNPLPIGYRTNNWLILHKSSNSWNGKLQEPTYDQLNYNNEEKSQQKIVEVFKNPYYGLRAGIMNIFGKAKKNGNLNFSVQDLIDAKYMQDPDPYRKYLINNNIEINKKFNLGLKEEGLELIFIILKLELGYGKNNKMYFIDMIPNYEKTYYINKAYDEILNMYKQRYPGLFKY